MFHVSIECDNSDGHRYYIENATALKNDRLRKWLLNSFNITNLVNEGQQMSERILLEDIPCGAEYISTIIGAMQQNKVLRIEYQAFYGRRYYRISTSTLLYEDEPSAMVHFRKSE